MGNGASHLKLTLQTTQVAFHGCLLSSQLFHSTRECSRSCGGGWAKVEDLCAGRLQEAIHLGASAAYQPWVTRINKLGAAACSCL